MSIQTLRRAFFAAVIAVASFGYEQAAMAQSSAQYIPPRPAISPYFAYSAVNTTGLPNYYTYIRPAQQARTFFEKEQANRARDEARLILDERRLDDLSQRRVDQRSTTGTGTTAVAGAFQQYSHYYPNPAVVRRR